MAKQPLVHCRRCKMIIDRDHQDDWVVPSRGWYYHKSCYEDFVKKQNDAGVGDLSVQLDNEDWKNTVYDYLTKNQKIAIDFRKFSRQWDAYLKKNMTAKGIYFCLRYFYEIKHGDPTKSEGGIGVIPYIYDEGARYWGERNQRDKGICARIEEQIQQLHAQKVKVVKSCRSQKKKVAIDLTMIASEEEDDG